MGHVGQLPLERAEIMSFMLLQCPMMRTSRARVQ